jgi:hypothetical protein
MERFGPYRREFDIGPSYHAGVAGSGSVIATATPSEIQLWDPAQGRRSTAISYVNPLGIGFSRDGAMLTAMSTVRASIALDVRRQTVQRMLGGPRGGGPGPIAGPCGTRLVFGSSEGDLVVRAVDSAEVALHERGSRRQISHLTCSPDRTLFAYVAATPGRGFTVVVRSWPFGANGPRDVVHVDDDTRRAKAIALDAGGRLAIRERDRLTTWDMSPDGGDCVAECSLALSVMQESMVWLPSGELVTTSRDSDGLRCVTMLRADLTEVASVPVAYACALGCSDSGELLVIGSWEEGLVMRRCLV